MLDSKESKKAGLPRGAQPLPVVGGHRLLRSVSKGISRPKRCRPVGDSLEAYLCRVGGFPANPIFHCVLELRI